MPSSHQLNPETPRQWWKKAQGIASDPAGLDILNYEAHSASKFDETDFIYLKVIWRNKPVTEFQIRDYVRAGYVKEATQFVATFINTSGSPFRLTDPGIAQLGPFFTTKWLLEQTRAANDGGEYVGGDTLKIVRRSERLRLSSEAKSATGKSRKEEAMLSQQMEDLTLDRPATPQRPLQKTPAQQRIGATPAALGDTTALEVISPESMDLEKARSEDEEIVNTALVNLLITMTLSSGITGMRGRQGLQWLPKRQSFSLGSANITVCEARTDGLLRSVGNLGPSGTLAILEAKPYPRDKAQIKIEWQEACQMAAWISTATTEKTAEKRRAGALSSPRDSNKKRYVNVPLSKGEAAVGIDVWGARGPVAFSSRRTTAFCTSRCGEWGKGYENHLNGEPRPATPPSKSNSPSQNRGRPEAAPDREHPSQTTETVSDSGPSVTREATPEDLDEGNFLVMHCYGPYSVGHSGHLRSFMRNVLALMLELSDPWE